MAPPEPGIPNPYAAIEQWQSAINRPKLPMKNLGMEIFNANNAASQVHAAQSKREDKRAQRVKASDRTQRFSGYLDEAELDAEIEQIEQLEATRDVAPNDQESAREDRKEKGFYSASGAEPPPKSPELDLEC